MIQTTLRKQLFSVKFSLRQCLLLVLGGMILAFGLYHIHSLSGVTEGGVLGATLLLEYWFKLSPALTSLLMNGICYALGFRVLGLQFILNSAICTLSFSASYFVCEQFPPLWPELSEMPLLAALLGALFVGVGVGLCVRAEGAPTGDDALAMALGKLFRVGIRWIYLISDLFVLLLSLSYIPFARIGFSLLTVVLSGQLIGWIEKAGKGEKEK